MHAAQSVRVLCEPAGQAVVLLGGEAIEGGKLHVRGTQCLVDFGLHVHQEMDIRWWD